MTLQEMSNEFDVLFNNLMSNQAPGIDEYEKSLFLTKAQSELIKAYFDPRGNKFQEGFDNGEKRQYDFSTIIKHGPLSTIQQGKLTPFDPRGLLYSLPEDVFLILNEQIREYDTVTGTTVQQLYRVLAIDYNQYAMNMSKPYKFPPKNVVWRLITNQNGTGPNGRSVCEIIGRFKNNYGHYSIGGQTITHPTYYMRYVQKPTPIILTDLSDGYGNITIDGHNGHPGSDPIAAQGGGVECILPPELHSEIVQRAVELAKATYDPQTMQFATSIGNLSSTNLGIIPQSNNRE